MQKTLIENKIRAALGDADIQLHSPDGVHFSAVVTARAFAGHSRLEQHRMVLKALEDVIDSNELHALQLQTVVAD